MICGIVHVPPAIPPVERFFLNLSDFHALRQAELLFVIVSVDP
jgi:hypothetical protein